VIGVYERHFAPGRRFVEKSKDKIAEIYYTLPRQLRSVPLLEALMGNNGANLMEAIFQVDLPPDEVGDLFPEEFQSPNLSRGTSKMSVAGVDGNLEVRNPRRVLPPGGRVIPPKDNHKPLRDEEYHDPHLRPILQRQHLRLLPIKTHRYTMIYLIVLWLG
jgi:hypothetical protein